MAPLATIFIFICFGILFTLIQFGITVYLRKKGRNSLLLQFIGLLANFMFVFTIAWVQASIAERVFQAAGMSVVFFGGVTLILAIVWWRLANIKKDYAALTWPSKKSVEEEVKADIQAEVKAES